MKILSLASALLATASLAIAAPEVGKPAPEFTLTDSNGKSHSLSDFKGKYVVLEWINFGCPFVKKFYEPGAMQKLQSEWTGKDVVWLAINSSASGKQGHFASDELKKQLETVGFKGTAYLVDEQGTVGKKYDAKTTPHMFVINPEGVLIYQGAIDNKKSTDSADIEGAANYVSAALDEAKAGKAVSTATTTPYGCSVKY
jgi:peroxiredoxin